MSNKEDLPFGCNSKSLDVDRVSIKKIVANLAPHFNSINEIELIELLEEAGSFVKAHNGNNLQLTMGNKEHLTTLDENRVSLKVAVDDLLSHFHSLNNNVAVAILQEAVSFAKAHNGSWKFWTCCHCDEKFDDRDLHHDHVMSMHLSTLPLEQRLVLPFRVSSDWYSMISNESWRPIDTSSALKMLQEQYELLLSKPNDAFKVTIDESELQSLEEPLKTREDDLNMRARKYYLAQTWPLSDDLDREKKLGIVSEFLNYLLVQNYLTESHLDKVISYTMKELKDSVSSVDVELLCLDQTHVCICFLQASQLEKVAGFLKDLFQSSTNFSDKYNIKDTVIPSTIGVENKEKLVLNGDSFFIFLDEYSLISGNSSNDDSDNIGTCNSDPLLRWIFTGPSSVEELESLMHLQNDDRKIQGKELIRTCEKYFGTLKHLVEEKRNQLSYKEALGLIWDCCLKELLMRSRDAHHVPRRFEEIFKGIEQNPLSIRKFDNFYPFSHLDLYKDMKIRSQDSHVMKAISNVLKEQQSIPKMGQIGFTPGISYHVNLPEDRLAEVWIAADSCVEAAVKREGANNDVELQETDAQIMQTLTSMRKMMFGINYFAAADFQAALLPLVKSYMQAYMKRFAHENARTEPVTVTTTGVHEQSLHTYLLAKVLQNYIKA